MSVFSISPASASNVAPMAALSGGQTFDASAGTGMIVDGTASTQWSNRPDSERFLNLIELAGHVHSQHVRSEQVVRANRDLHFDAVEDGTHKGLYVMVEGPRERSQVRGDRVPVDPTHWTFGQLARLVSAPSDFLRQLPSELVADILNYRYRYDRSVEEMGMMFRRPEFDTGAHREMAAATGPGYGRIFNDDIAKSLVRNFGDGLSGDWRVPGIFGKPLDVITKQDTTFYASDRDMFVFLTDERNKIEVKNRRNGKDGLMSRGFYVWNSEVGATSFGLASFFFDEVCMNRNIWGVEGFEQIRFRHSSGAPHRFVERALPLLERYAQTSTATITTQIEAARAKKIDDVDSFLANRKFSKGVIADIKAQHMSDEGRPIETIWDMSNGITGLARSIDHQDERVALERKAGEVFALAA